MLDQPRNVGGELPSDPRSFLAAFDTFKEFDHLALFQWSALQIESGEVVCVLRELA